MVLEKEPAFYFLLSSPSWCYEQPCTTWARYPTQVCMQLPTSTPVTSVVLELFDLAAVSTVPAASLQLPLCTQSFCREFRLAPLGNPCQGVTVCSWCAGHAEVSVSTCWGRSALTRGWAQRSPNQNLLLGPLQRLRQVVLLKQRPDKTAPGSTRRMLWQLTALRCPAGCPRPANAPGSTAGPGSLPRPHRRRQALSPPQPGPPRPAAPRRPALLASRVPPR